jgi:hypothetical protein
MAKPKYQVSGTVESKKGKSLQQKALEAPEYKALNQARSPEEHQDERRAAKEARDSQNDRGSQMLPSWDPRDEDFDTHEDFLGNHRDSDDDYDFYGDYLEEYFDDLYDDYYEAEFEDDI